MTRSESPTQALGTRIPDFFIVGHPKCGTTALYEMLRRHPQIYMPELKETRWFARELHPRTPSSTHPRSLEEYLALFAAARPDQRAGEASPSYLRSPEAAGRIAELQPHARIIAILREPASFLHSLHMELMRDHVETEKDLAKAIALEQQRSSEQQLSRRPGLVYSDYVRYVEQLRRYHAVFPPEQVKVLIYDDFRADNEATVRAVMSFLGVEDSAPLELTEANPSVRVRSPRLNEMVRSLYLGRGPVGRALKAPIKALTPARVRRGGLEAFQRRAVYGRPQPADERLMLALRRRFRDEVIALSDYLDRDLVRLWGYDGID
jgi:hypothetical protein